MPNTDSAPQEVQHPLLRTFHCRFQTPRGGDATFYDGRVSIRNFACSSWSLDCAGSNVRISLLVDAESARWTLAVQAGSPPTLGPLNTANGSHQAPPPPPSPPRRNATLIACCHLESSCTQVCSCLAAVSCGHALPLCTSKVFFPHPICTQSEPHHVSWRALLWYCNPREISREIRLKCGSLTSACPLHLRVWPMPRSIK